MRRLSFGAVLFAVCAIAPSAGATPNFPGIIQADVKAPSPPPCTICHTDNNGGAGTVTKPFGIYMRSRGLQPFDGTSLKNALAAAAGEHHDTDGDGIDDVDALARGLDPNGSGVEAPDYGCVGQVARGPARGMGSSAFVTLCTIVTIALLRRRRPRIPGGDA